SCRSSEELQLAEALGVDFAVLGPVRATPSHPHAVPLGWERFSEIAKGAAVPVYALGGIVPRDLEQALNCGAHGIAMVRGAWESCKSSVLPFRVRGVLVFLPVRYTVLLHRPLAELAQLAAFRAQRPEVILGQPA